MAAPAEKISAFPGGQILFPGDILIKNQYVPAVIRRQDAEGTALQPQEFPI